MSASFTAVFETEVPDIGTLGGDHPAILRHIDQIDRLAVEQGLTPLGEFESYDPEDVAEFMSDEELSGLPPVEWFAASEGLAAVNALQSHLGTQADVLPDQVEVLTDLTNLQAELTESDRAGVRFRFAIVM